MSGNDTLTKASRYKPTSYFLLTIVITTIFWIIGAYYSFEPNNQYYVIFLLIGLVTPSIVALVMILNAKEQAIKSLFFKKLVDIRGMNLKLLPLLLLLMPLSVVVSIFLSTLIGESLTQQLIISERFSFSTGFVPVLLLLLFAAIFEELGWRGYGFESLHSRFNFFYASLYFSFLWAIWHLPLVVVNNSYQYEIMQQNYWYAVNFFISIVPMGMIVSWICYKNNGSILIAIVFHFIINISQEALEITQTTKMVQTFVLFFVVAALIYYDKKLYFKKIDS